MSISKTRASEASPVGDRVSLEVKELDAVIESLTRLSDVRHQHPTLELLMNNVPFGVLLLDTDLKLLGANRAYTDFFDPTADFAPGAPLHQLLPGADESGITTLLRRSLERGRAVRVKNFRYDGFNKGVTYWNGSAIPVRLHAKHGPHDAVAMVVLEITDEILAREQLANYAVLAERRAVETEIERARLNSVIEAVPVPIIVCDANQSVTAFNSAATQLCESAGMRSRLDEGSDFGRLFPVRVFADDGTRLTKDQLPMMRSLAGEECRNEIIQCWPSSRGPRRIFTVSSAPLRAANGSITGAVAAIADITQQRRVQEQIEESYQREHAIATKLQETFLACDLPEMHGFEYQQSYHAAKDASLVGGDFYDIFRVGEHKYAIVMGDVAGKGLKSAVYTAMTKYILRAYALEKSDPNLALARLNDALSVCTPSELFVTLVYGVLDCRDRVFTYANAGHEHPLLLRGEHGEVHKMEVTGRALALLEGSTYTTHSVELSAGDVMLFYTDGITDAGFGLDRMGQDRLMELVRSNGTGSLDDLVGAVVGAARQFAGGVISDDAALLAIRAI